MGPQTPHHPLLLGGAGGDVPPRHQWVVSLSVECEAQGGEGEHLHGQGLSDVLDVDELGVDGQQGDEGLGAAGRVCGAQTVRLLEVGMVLGDDAKEHGELAHGQLVDGGLAPHGWFEGHALDGVGDAVHGLEDEGMDG